MRFKEIFIFALIISSSCAQEAPPISTSDVEAVKSDVSNLPEKCESIAPNVIQSNYIPLNGTTLDTVLFANNTIYAEYTTDNAVRSTIELKPLLIANNSFLLMDCPVLFEFNGIENHSVMLLTQDIYRRVYVDTQTEKAKFYLCGMQGSVFIGTQELTIEADLVVEIDKAHIFK